MGLFRKKLNLNRIYSLPEALQMLKQPELARNYTLVEEGTGYRMITLEQSQRLQREVREKEAIKNSFAQRINGGGSYQNRQTPPVNDNLYQRAKGYGIVR